MTQIFWKKCIWKKSVISSVSFQYQCGIIKSCIFLFLSFLLKPYLFWKITLPWNTPSPTGTLVCIRESKIYFKSINQIFKSICHRRFVRGCIMTKSQQPVDPACSSPPNMPYLAWNPEFAKERSIFSKCYRAYVAFGRVYCCGDVLQLSDHRKAAVMQPSRMTT
jgi:hypothetical protein